MRGGNFRAITELTHVEVIAAGREIRDLAKLNRKFGNGRWRKLKGRSYVEYDDGQTAYAEVHWYEAHGIGKRALKVAKLL